VLSYISRRLVGIVGVLLATCLITFAIFFVFPANPAEQICGKKCTPQIIATIDQQWGLNEPLYQQFEKYVAGIFAGRTYGQGTQVDRCPVPCLGYSYQNDMPVTSEIAQRLPVSASIAAGAGVLWLAGGVGMGVISALRRDTWLDKVITTIALGGIAAPTMLVGILMLYVFSAKTSILPYPSYTSILSDPGGWAQGMIMPWITLALYYASVYQRYSRASMIEALNQDFITTARAKGLRERTVVVKHGLRAGLMPILTLYGMDIGALLGGSIIIEEIFGMPGLGTLYMQAIQGVDIPTVTGITLLAAFFVIAANLVVDVLYAVIDPKVRLG
jgi:peptide/nickel transport system permease protein